MTSQSVFFRYYVNDDVEGIYATRQLAIYGLIRLSDMRIAEETLHGASYRGPDETPSPVEAPAHVETPAPIRVSQDPSRPYAVGDRVRIIADPWGDAPPIGTVHRVLRDGDIDGDVFIDYRYNGGRPGWYIPSHAIEHA